MNINRRTLIAGAGLATASVALPAVSDRAAAGTPSGPLPGLVRRKVGTVEVTALLDGYLDVDESLLLGYDAAVGADLARAAFHQPGAQRIPVSAYLVNTGEKLVLVDAGSADTFGPTLGALPEALKAAGATPADIDTLAITHLHPDHINGALAADGSALFPNAELAVSEAEYRFWHDEGFFNQAEGAVRNFFLGARKGAEAYADRTRQFTAGEEIAPGIRSEALPGHTPGHTGFRIASGAESLLIWGDVAHIAAYQFARPNWAIAFDVDPDLARQTRRKALDMAASDRLLIAGMHLPFPGFGHVAREGDAYGFVPAEWPYAL